MKKNYSLVGVDGNIFAVIGYVANIMKKEGYTREEQNSYKNEVIKSNSYEEAVAKSMDMIDRVNKGIKNISNLSKEVKAETKRVVDFEEYNSKLDNLFDELVPVRGKADTKAGEIIRAFGKINYRFYNDGDQIGVDYGNETTNAPARYLISNTNKDIASTVKDMWGLMSEKLYEKKLKGLLVKMVDYIENNPELKNQDNTDDMLNYFDEDDRKWGSNYEENGFEVYGEDY